MTGKFPHLPPGHPPGPQSLRNAEAERRVKLYSPLLAAATFAVCVVVGAASGELLAWAGGGALVALLLLADVAWRRYRARSERARLSARLPILETSEFRRGHVIPISGAPADVGLTCTAIYDHEIPIPQGGTIRQTSRSVVFEQWLGADETPGGALWIPPDAPFSYEGDCLSFAWHVSIARPHRLRRATSTDQPIWVRP